MQSEFIKHMNNKMNMYSYEIEFIYIKIKYFSIIIM